MPTLRELRTEAARIVTEAQALLETITDDNANEINQRFDQMMTDAAAIEARAERMEAADGMRARLESMSDRVPDVEDRTAPAAQAPEQVTYARAFDMLLRSGSGNPYDLPPAARAALARGEEHRAQVAGTPSGGGFLVPDEPMQAIVMAMAMHGPMYQDNFAFTIDTTSGGSLPIPTVNDTASTAEENTSEGAALTDDGGKDVTFGEVNLQDYMIDTEWLRVSIQLATSATEIGAILAELLGERLGRKTNAWLTTGTGTNQPQGIVTGSAVGHTAASNSALTADEILDLYNSIDPAYRQAPKFRAMMNDSTRGVVHKLKDGDGNYLLRPRETNLGDISNIGVAGALQIGATRIPYAINQGMSTIGASARSIVMGDFNKYVVRRIGGVVVGTAQGRSFLPGYGIMGYTRLDGRVTDTRALKCLVHPGA